MITAFEYRSGTKRRTLVAAIVLLFGACSTNASRHEADFNALLHSLPGIYTSAPAAVRLAITPFIAQAVGDHLYFVRQTAAGNEHLVLAERIWMLTLDKQGHLIQQLYVFKDPRHWLGAAEHRDLLLGMLPEDLTPLSGCELLWDRNASGFAAEPLRTPDPCEPGSTVQGQWLERELKLEGSQLSVNERQVGSDGALAASSGVTALTLQRRANAPATRSPF